MSSALTDLFPLPIVQAPMAGGASGPRLAAAVSEAGGLGFLAAGYKTADGMYHEIKQLRGLTDRPFGVNLFLPQPEYADPAAVAVYRDQLAGEAAWYETELGDSDCGRDDGYEAKLAVLLDDPVPVVSFTFGCPSEKVLAAFARAGTVTVVTATTPEEARAAERAGADAVCAQGIEAGGHQGTHRDQPERDGSGYGLLALVAEVREAVGLPVVAGGGLMRGTQIAAVLAAGAVAGQLGTAFLVTPESGAHPLHKEALTSSLFVRTELTRAFTGRPARGLVNRFLREHGPYAPAAYPQVHHLAAPLRRAAEQAGDPQGMALWAGQGHRMARELPAKELVEVLAAELDDARTAAWAPPGGPGHLAAPGGTGEPEGGKA
ncbi:oxidoreductase [Streptomyces sulfonofaciens]|uniref:Probable nitronate monooxygenase n=1 Tax=Streptomyces sulfonofaciens TaxID=68272 RepID=A0A919GNJ5_9ACTN|nr:nitronate monooxygenase [Streptomyces sulfonofaciens]GHH87348.1 oxidoreductase [Streptomyces sulfonofaciens]